MRVLILGKNANGIINLKEHEHFVIDHVKEFRDILSEIIKRQKSQFDYKYCILEDDSFIPFFMDVRDKLFNQMQEFNFDRIKFKDIPASEEEKRKIIMQIVDIKNNERINELEKIGLKLILRKEFGQNIEEEFLKVGEELELLENELKNIDYDKHMDKLV